MLCLPDPDLMYKAVLEHARQLALGVEPDDFEIVKKVRQEVGRELAEPMSGNYKCNYCGTEVDNPAQGAGFRGTACFSCARDIRERQIDTKEYPPPNCWVTVRDGEETIDAVLVDAVDDGLYAAFIYPLEGKREFRHIRFDDMLKPRGKKPQYTIPTRYKPDVDRWVKEIEGC